MLVCPVLTLRKVMTRLPLTGKGVNNSEATKGT